MELKDIVDHCAYMTKTHDAVWVVGSHPGDGATVVVMLIDPEIDEDRFDIADSEDFIELLTDDEFKPTNVTALAHWNKVRRDARPAAKITLSAAELYECSKNPVVLRALADVHDCKQTEAEAADFPGDFHEQRRKELLAAADAIQADWEA